MTVEVCVKVADASQAAVTTPPSEGRAVRLIFPIVDDADSALAWI